MTVTEDRPTSQQTQAAGRVVRVIGPVVDVEFPPRRDARPVQRAARRRHPGRPGQDADPRGRPAPRRQHRPRHLDAADRRPGPRRRGHRHRRADHGAGRRRRPRATCSTPSASRWTCPATALDITERWPIHRARRRRSTSSRAETEMFETGIKVIDLLTPVRAGRQDRPVRRCRRGQDRADPGDDPPGRPELRWRLGVRRRRRAHP